MIEVKHPAKYSDAVLACMAAQIGSPDWLLLDPFAGTGLVHRLHCRTVGVELEPEWAALHHQTIVGNALALPFPEKTFDAVMTSPSFGNRLADAHNARDGSYRLTYTHVLGRKLHSDNSGAMQWSAPYRRLHQDAWREAVRVLKPGGRFLLDIKDHARRGTPQHVPEWHYVTLEALGLKPVRRWFVDAKGFRYGKNLHPEDPMPQMVMRFDKPLTLSGERPGAGDPVG